MIRYTVVGYDQDSGQVITQFLEATSPRHAEELFLEDADDQIIVCGIFTPHLDNLADTIVLGVKQGE